MKRIRKRKIISGVYLITCLTNKKVYVGSSANSIFKRIRDHQIALEKGTHANEILQRTYNKYGKENFVFEKLESCAQEVVLLREQYWMDLLSAYDRKLGFNIVPKAGSSYGHKRTEEQKRKSSESHKEKGISKGEKNPRFGVKISEEQKEKTRKRWLEVGFLKPFYAIDKDLNIVGEYESAIQASKIIKCDSSLITGCLKNKWKTGKDLAFCYVSEIDKKLEEIKLDTNYFNKRGIGITRGNTKKVKITDLQTLDYKIYESSNKAAKQIGLSKTFVYSCLKGYKKSKKFKIEYYEEV